MDFTRSPEQEEIRAQVARICTDFPDEYWLQQDRAARFPHEFFAAMAKGGWLGIALSLIHI